MAAARTKKNESGKKNPRILIVTPEITYLPEGMGNLAGRMSAKAGGMADVSASLVGALFDLGADVHVALPHYRRMFHEETGQLVADELRVYKSRMTSDRIHLAEPFSYVGYIQYVGIMEFQSVEVHVLLRTGDHLGIEIRCYRPHAHEGRFYDYAACAAERIDHRTSGPDAGEVDQRPCESRMQRYR